MIAGVVANVVSDGAGDDVVVVVVVEEELAKLEFGAGA